MDTVYNLCVEYIPKHEGVSYKPYSDTVGKLTIGIGRNLTDVGLSKDEVMYLFKNDLNNVIHQLADIDWYKNLDDVRKYVIVDMCFNLGLRRLLEFQSMIKYIIKEDYAKAAREMLDSKWADQVKSRAIDLAKIMEAGRIC